MRTADIIMWILAIVILAGLIITLLELQKSNADPMWFKYDGLVISAVGLIASCIVGVKTNKIENFTALF